MVDWVLACSLQVTGVVTADLLSSQATQFSIHPSQKPYNSARPSSGAGVDLMLVSWLQAVLDAGDLSELLPINTPVAPSPKITEAKTVKDTNMTLCPGRQQVKRRQHHQEQCVWHCS